MSAPLNSLDRILSARAARHRGVCDLCLTGIVEGSIFDTHGYGECVEMPDNFGTLYFDELRHRGVAIIRLWRDGRERFDLHEGWQLYRREPAGYPRDVKYRVMLTKANAIANGYYVAKSENLRQIHGANYWRINMGTLARIEVPSYETLRNMLLDGDFTDDGDPEGGDYVLACRVALMITAERYRPFDFNR